MAIFNFHFLDLAKWGVPVPAWLNSMLFAQVTGVSLFFTLSGFILAYAYSEMEPRKPADRRKFFVSRFARIYPVYFLALIWFAPFILTHRFSSAPLKIAAAKSVASFFPALFLVQSWISPRFALAWNGPGWTLSVEAAFYLIFPLALPLIRRMTDRGKLQFAGCMVLLSALLSVSYMPLPHPYRGILANWVLHWPLFHFPTFLVGTALGMHFVSRGKTSKRAGDWMFYGGLAGVVLLAVNAMALPPLLLEIIAMVPFFGLMIYGLAIGGGPGRFLGSPALVLLGESSYALYILQFSVGFTVASIVDRNHFHDFIQSGMISPMVSWPVYYLLLMFSLIGISVLTFRYVETPLRRAIRGRFAIPRRAIADTVGEFTEPEPAAVVDEA